MDFSKGQSTFNFCLSGIMSLSSMTILALISASLNVVDASASSGMTDATNNVMMSGQSAWELMTLENLFWSPALQGPKTNIQNIQSAPENEIQLFHVTSDALKGSLEIKAVVNANSELLGLKYLTEKGEVLNFNIEQLSQGAVLLKDSGKSVVRIVGHQLTSTSGGSLELIYLEDGLSDSYAKFNMRIVNSQGKWEMETLPSSGSKKFTKMYLKGNWFFGKVIGIAEVSVN